MDKKANKKIAAMFGSIDDGPCLFFENHKFILCVYDKLTDWQVLETQLEFHHYLELRGITEQHAKATYRMTRILEKVLGPRSEHGPLVAYQDGKFVLDGAGDLLCAHKDFTKFTELCIES